jgi:hypothetical protein
MKNFKKLNLFFHFFEKIIFYKFFLYLKFFITENVITPMKKNSNWQ